MRRQNRCDIIATYDQLPLIAFLAFGQFAFEEGELARFQFARLFGMLAPDFAINIRRVGLVVAALLLMSRHIF